MKLWDGNEVTVYYQAAGPYVFNQMLTADECVSPYKEQRRNDGKMPLCTVLNGGFNAGSERYTQCYPQIIYELNDNGRMMATISESPTLIPCWSGHGLENFSEDIPTDLENSSYGRWYWNENKNDNYLVWR